MSAESDVAYLHVGDCDRCGSTTAPTRVVTRLTGERLTICTDAFGCWEREQTCDTPPAVQTHESPPQPSGGEG